LTTNWLTIATTTAASAAPGPDDNILARNQGATPFKRPENGQFQPGSQFKTFFFDETGDTNATSSANAQYGGWGTVQKLSQDPSSDSGTLQLFYYGEQAHSGFDNVAFFDQEQIGFVEDAGDTLHTQRNAFDSAFMFDVSQSYCGTGKQPVRFLAQGRDASATLDSANGGFGRNDQDNEITGMHVSDGDPTISGLLGIKPPHPFDPDGHWRVFYTQQHGDNPTYEIVPSP
jgi:secreted PhoX family phosphatase